MKTTLLTAIITLFAACTYAQVGMPKELTCTERAFNFSFNVGTNWKISTPRMGPVEVTREELDLIPDQLLKPNDLTAITPTLSFDLLPSNTQGLNYSQNRQNYILPLYRRSSEAMNKSYQLIPNFDFNLPVSYRISIFNYLNQGLSAYKN